MHIKICFPVTRGHFRTMMHSSLKMIPCLCRKGPKCFPAVFSNLAVMLDMIWLHLWLSNRWSCLTRSGRWECAQSSIWHLSESHYHKAGKRKGQTYAAWNITVSPSQLCCHSSCLWHDMCHKWAKIFCFGKIITMDCLHESVQPLEVFTSFEDVGG